MAISTQPLSYNHEDRALTGFLAWDDSTDEERPGLLLVHGGGGLDDHAKGQAKRYAELGYTVLACDMFGHGIAGDRERIVATVTSLRDDPELLVARAAAGLSALASCQRVDGRCAAIGFCFGGMTVLTMARHHCEVAAVVSLHGSLKTTTPASAGSVNAKILACHGALDPHVPMADVVAFTEEMNEVGADWQLNVYGGAMHGFTHDHAVPGAFPGVEYHEEADRRSFRATAEFLAAVLQP